MNLLLDDVVTDVTGKTGMTIIRAIMQGERDPDSLAAYPVLGSSLQKECTRNCPVPKRALP